MDDPLFPQEFKVQVPGSYQPGQTFSLQGDQLNLRTLPRSFCTHRAGLFGKEDKYFLSREVPRVAAKQTPRGFLELITQLKN